MVIVVFVQGLLVEQLDAKREVSFVTWLNSYPPQNADQTDAGSRDQFEHGKSSLQVVLVYLILLR